MTDEQIKERILNFIKNHSLTVISTVDVENNKPEAAVIAFAEKADLCIFFGTSNKTRKYKNLQTNQNVAFVIGWEGRVGTVQYEGVARELSAEESETHAELMALKNKQSAKFINRDDQRYFIVKPNWIRLVDNNPESAGTFEISL